MKEMELVRFCLKDKSSILGYVTSLQSVFDDINNNNFIMYTNKESNKQEIINTSEIRFVRMSSKE